MKDQKSPAAKRSRVQSFQPPFFKEAKQLRRKELEKAKFDHKKYKEFIREEIARIPNVNQEPLELILDQLTPRQLEIIRDQTQSSASREFRATMLVLILALCTGHMGAQEGVDFVLPEIDAYDFLPDYSEALARALEIANKVTSAAAPFVPMAVSKSRKGAAAMALATLGSLPNAEASGQKVVTLNGESFFLACAKGDLKLVTLQLEAIKNEIKKGSSGAKYNVVKEILLFLDKKKQSSALFVAVGLGHVEIAEQILEAVKDSDEILTAMLTGTNLQYEFTVLSYASAKGHYKVVEKILNSVKNNPKLLEIILLQKDKKGSSPLLWASDNKYDKIVKLILDAVKKHPEIAKKILRQTTDKKASPLRIASYYSSDCAKLIVNAAKSVDMDFLKEILESSENSTSSILRNVIICLKDHEVIKFILDAIGDDVDFLEKILTLKGRVLMTASYFNNFKVMEVILEALIPNHIEVLKKVLGEDASKFLNELLILGHDNLIKKVLSAYPEIKIEQFPDHYIAPNSGRVPFYIGSLISTGLFKKPNLEVKFFSLGADGQPRLSISTDISSDKPFLIDIAGKKTLVAPFFDSQHYEFAYKDQFKRNFKQYFELALNNKADIVFKLNGEYEAQGGHSVALKLSPPAKKDGLWQVSIFDSNAILTDEYFCKIVKRILPEMGIKISEPKIEPVIMLNFSAKDDEGSCSQVADINVAIVAIGLEKSAREFCRSKGRGCLDVLVEELHPPIKKSLSAKLKKIKEEMKNPPAMPSPRESQKLAGEQHLEL
ncbi:MAG: ankyrin repeat domain-containing protein [Pseudomonadota bacterium]